MAVRPRKKTNAAIKYVSNVARSVRYASLDAIKEYVPVIVDTVDTNADIAKVTYTSIKHSKETVQKAQRALIQSQIGELAVDLKKNLIEDLKSGNFYNKKRVDDVNDFAAENFSFGFDTEATGDDDFFGDGFDTEAGGDDSTHTIAEAIDVISERTMDGIANVTIRSAEYQVEASRQANIRLMSQISAGYAQTHGDLSAINANITGIVKFQNEAIVTHFENSRAFYERQQEQMSEQTSILKEMLELQKKSAGVKKDGSSSRSVGISDIFSGDGALNISGYAKYVGKNIKNMDTGMGDMLKMMLDMGIGKSLTANPVGELMKGAVKAFLPAYFKESLEQFNESISGAISTALLNITKMQDDFSSPLKQKIGDIFGLNVFNKTKLDVSAYEKGAVSWNGKDHKALTEVIPMLLSDIRSALTGDETKVYDYEKGRFKGVNSIKKDFDKIKQQEIDSANRDVMDYLNQQIKRLEFDSSDQEKRLREDINKIMTHSFKYLEYFNPNDAEAYTYGLNDKIGKYNFDLIKKMYKNIPKHKQMSANRNLVLAKSKYNEQLKAMEQSGDSVYNMLFNGIFDEKTKNKTNPVTGGLSNNIIQFAKQQETYFDKLIKQQANYENILKAIEQNTSRIPDIKSSNKENVVDKVKEIFGFGKQKTTAQTKPTTTPAATNREGNTKQQQQQTKSSSDQDAAAAAASKKESKTTDIQNSIKSKYGSKVDDMLLYIDPNENDAKVGPELIKKLEESETATKKIKTLIKGTITFAQAPLELFGGVLRKVDERMYSLLFGESKKEDEKKPITTCIKDGFTNFFKDLKSNALEFWDGLKRGKTAEKIKDKLDETLHNMFGYTMEEFKIALFGEKNKNKSLGEGIAGLFKQGFKDTKTSIKNFFKSDEDILAEAITGEKNATGEAKDKKRKSNKILSKVVQAAQDVANKNKPKDEYGNIIESEKKKKTDEDDGTGEVEKAATGARRVKKTGIIAVSEGEMIVPPDMNPFNINKRYKDENEAIKKFKDTYGSNYPIASYAAGGVVNDFDKNLNQANKTRTDFSKAIAEGTMTPDDVLTKIMEEYNVSSEEEAKALFKLLGMDVSNFLNGADTRKARRNANKSLHTNRSDYVEGKEHIGYKMADEAKAAAGVIANEVNSIMTSVLGGDITKSFSDRIGKAYKNDKIKAAAADTVLNFREYLPSVLAGGATGAGLSVLLGAVGGPLVWGAVGGGLGLLSKSNKLQELLFGELAEDKDGNITRNGKGILPQKLVKGIDKYAKSMIKNSAIGAILTSTILPGGPITGLMVGSALGFAQHNERIQDYLFGEEGKLKDIKTLLSAKLPRMGVGAAAGLIAGPFGPVTNMIIGAGVGMVSDTNTFKDAIFGTISGDGKRYGGLVGFIKESLEIPANMLIQTITEFKDAVVKDIVDPLKDAGRALSQAIKNIGTGIMDRIANSFEDHVTRPVGAFVTEKIIRPIEERMGNLIKKIFGGIWKTVTAPVRFAGMAGKMIQGRQLDAIGKGGGTAAERIARRDLMDRDSKLAKAKGWVNNITGMDIFNEAKRTNSIGNKVDVAAVDMSREDLTKFTIAGETLDSRLGKRKSVERIAKEELLKGGLSKFLDTYRWRRDENGEKLISGTELKLIKDELMLGSCKNSIRLIESNVRIPEREKEIIIGILGDAVKRRNEALKSAKNAKKISDAFEKKYGFRMEDRNVQRVFKQQLNDLERAKTSKFEEELDGRKEHENEKDLAHTMAVEFKLDQKHKEVTDIMKDMLKIMKGEKPKDKKPKQLLSLPGSVDEPIARDDGSILYAKGSIAQPNYNIPALVDKKANESKSVMTENGIILLKRDRQGNEQPDERDSETRLTLRRRDQKEETQKGILAKIGSLGDTMQNAFFGEKEEKKPSLLSKILKVGAGLLGFGAGLLGTKGAAILGALGLTTVAGMKIKVAKRDAQGNILRDADGNVIKEESTVGDAVYKAVERLWMGKDLTGKTSGIYYNIKGFTRDHLLPAVGAGIDWLSERLPGAIESGISILGNLAGDIAENLISGLISHAPQIIWGGIKGIAKGVIALVKGKREVQETEEIESKYKFTPSNAVANSKGTSPSSKPKASNSNITLAMQNAFDNGSYSMSSGAYGSAKIDNHKNLTTAVQAKISRSTGDSSGSSVDKETYSKAKGYKNLDKALRSKADDSLASVWNNDSGYGMTIGELLDNDSVVVGYVTDQATGEQIPVTGADILKYPDVAKQFGIDMHLTQEERSQNSERNGANASKKSILENNIGRSIVTGGKYGVSSKVSRFIGRNAGKTMEAIGNGADWVSSKIFRKKVLGKTLKAYGHGAGAVLRAGGYTGGLAKDLGANIRKTGSLTGAIGETGNIIKGDLSKAASRFAENNPEMVEKGSKFINKTKDIAGNIKNTISNAADKVADSKVLSNINIKGSNKTSKKSKLGKLNEMATKFLDYIKKLVSKFFANSKFIGYIKKVVKHGAGIKKIAEAKISDALTKFGKKLIDKATDKLAGKVVKGLGTACAKLGAYIGSGGLVAVGFIVADFISGWTKADVTFKVQEPNYGERFISGLLKALLNTCFLSLVIDEGDLVNMITSLLEDLGVKMDSLRERQEEAKEACKQYNLEHGSDISVEDYLASQHLSSKIKQAIKNKAMDVWNAITGKSTDKDEAEEKANNMADKIETVADDKAKFYDNEGNLVGKGMDENGYIKTMYVPQGNATTTNDNRESTDKKKGGLWSKIKSIFDKKKDDIDNMPSSDSNIKGEKYKASDQDVINATSGVGGIISTQNQSHIKSAVEEVNNSIPSMIKSLKENLASYFGLKGSDLNRANKVGENTLRNKGPLQVFKQLNNMWRRIAINTNPILSMLPDSMGSGLANVSRFMAIALGLADPGDTGVDLTTIAQSNSYLNTRAEMIADSSPIYGLLGGVTGSNSNNATVQRNAAKKSSAKKKGVTAGKVTSSKKTGTIGSIIGKILGTGKGSGIGYAPPHQTEKDFAADKDNFISQRYGQYANKSFTVSGDKERTKVSDAGCAPAVATMASKLVGLSTPIDMNQAIKDALPYKQPNEGVSADYFIDEFDKHNIQTSFITNQNSEYEKTIKNRLMASKPVILMGKDENNKSKAESPFGSSQHYVLATKLDPNGNDVYINDPEAKKPNIKYNLKKVLSSTTLGILPNMVRGIKGVANKSKNQLKNALKMYSAMGKYGSDTIQYKVYTGLRRRGFDEIHACAIMGNMQAESGFNPSVVEGATGIGFGLCQWSYGRRTKIEAYAASKGKSAGDVEIQLDFLKGECTPGGGCDGYANYAFMARSYEGRNWPADTFQNATDIETATRGFCYNWEGPLDGPTLHLDVRLNAAKEFYQEFTGTPVPAGEMGISTDASGSQTGEKKSGGTIIDKIISAFTAIGSSYGLSGDGDDGSGGDIESGGSARISTGGITGNVSSDPEIAKKQKEVVAMMKSKEGQLAYSQAQRNPDYGSGDCSSTIQWAYQKVMGQDVGANTWAQEVAPTTYTAATSTADESKLQLGDLLLMDGHVEMYYGDGKMIGHGGGATGTVPGPTISNLGGSPPFNIVRRLNAFRGKGSGLPFISQRDSRYANKSIGDEKVADAGCAPAVATMAVNALTGKGGLTMNDAIKNASGYKDGGGVTADYFADEFANHGIGSDYVTGDNLYRTLSSGSPTVLLGRDSNNKSKANSPFGSTNHYVLANGLSKDGRSVYINDPEGTRGNIKYPVNILKNSVMGVAPRAGGSKIINLAERKLKRFSGGATRKILYVGDSRTVGMQAAVNDSNVEFIGQVGAGLSWLQSSAIGQVNAKINSDTSYNVVFCFGVNDLGNVNNYINFYKSWKNSNPKVKVWFMSVNPVTKPCSVSNDQISNFNNTLKGSGLGNYIDTYNHIKDSATASDGLHYDAETYKKIHQYVVSAIGGGSGDSSGSVTGESSSSGGGESVMDSTTSAITSLANAWFGGFLDSDTSSGADASSGDIVGDTSATGDTRSVDRSPGGKDERALTGSTSYPTYDLNSSTKTLVAKLITGETGGYDAILAKQKASMLANVNEVGYGRASTSENLRTTMNKYPKSSLQKGATQTAKTAVEEVLVKGKRTLPRYVTVEGKFPSSVTNAKDRSAYKRGDAITSTGGSKYKFYNFMGASKNGNISGYFDGNYEKYKGDVVWAGAGSGLFDDTNEGGSATQSTPSFGYLNNGTSSTAQTINAINVKANSTTDKLIELVIKLLGQVVDNTVSIKDIAKLLTQYISTRGTDQANISNSDYDSVKKQILSTNDNLLQTMSEITQSQNVQTLEKLIANVESIAAM